MQNITDAGPLADYPPQVVLQAVLATKLTSFTEFAFGVCAARHSLSSKLPKPAAALESINPAIVTTHLQSLRDELALP